MKAPKPTPNPTETSTSSRNFFSKKGEDSFFTSAETPFFSPQGIQPKLRVGAAGDSYEQEADAVAEKVVSGGIVNRKPVFEGEENEGEQVQTQSQGTGSPAPQIASPSLESGLQSARGGGQPLAEGVRSEMEQGFGASFEEVKIHTDSRAAQMNQQLGARAFTHGSDIYFNSGNYDAASSSGKRLLAHELTHVLQQRSAVRRSPDAHIQRNGNPTPIERLNEMLDRFNVPEEEVISTCGLLSAAEKATVLAGGYRSRMASALNVGEMVRAVNNLGPVLATKLEWVNDAAFATRLINYSDIQGMVTSAPQAEKDALKINYWKNFFVAVCTNATMVQALNDLNFDLETKLSWLHAEMTITSLELNYATIKPWITAASQAERDALKTVAWRNFFVDVCTNTTMVEALNDLGYDLVTKLTWLYAEMTITRLELSYATIKPWILAAPQADKDSLKTAAWKAFFVEVCTNATMVEAVTDLGYDLKTQLEWAMAEWCFYADFKTLITAASAADKAALLADHAFLRTIMGYFLFWNDFAKTVELLGRSCPTGAQMIANATVQAQLAAAWTASNPAIVPAGGPVPAGVHEEGGFIYMNLITGNLSTDTVSPGRQASLPLNNPSPPAESILVGGYHTHPNVGPAWGAPFASGADTNWATRNGVPLLFRGAFPAVANVSDGSTGPTRLHLAGPRGFPGAAGGVAPQALEDGSYDALQKPSLSNTLK